MKTFFTAIFILAFASIYGQDFTKMYASVQESVVPIFTESDKTVAVGTQVKKASSQGLGTGSIVSSTGLVLTASHVVSNAKTILVQIGERNYKAKIIRNSQEADVALLQIEAPPSNLKPLKLGDSDLTKIGEQIFVIGYPHGLGKTFTMGHIGGKHAKKRNFSKFNEIELLQTDASINSGNSGGPMFNMKGEVIGIVSSILTNSGGFEGVGFAATINIARDHLISDGNLWTGIEGILISGDFALAMNIPALGGIFVQTVVEGSPGYLMGLNGGIVPVNILGEEIMIGGDVILKIDGISCDSEEKLDQIRDQISKKNNGEKVELIVFRGGTKRTINWTIKRDPIPVK